MSGEYKVSFFEFQLLTDSNAKTFEKSFIDYFKHFTAAPLSIFPIDPVNDFVYKPRKQPMIANEYMRWGPQQYIDPSNQWYGAKTLWSYQIDQVIPKHQPNVTTTTENNTTATNASVAA